VAKSIEQGGNLDTDCRQADSKKRVKIKIRRSLYTSIGYLHHFLKIRLPNIKAFLENKE
jgi:hypothetical protein